MSLDNAFFVSAIPVPKEVTLPDGSTHTIHFKELESAYFERFHEQRASDVEAIRHGSMPTLIAAAVCEPDGKPSMTVAKAMQLKPKVQIMLSGVIMEMNGLKAKKELPSEEVEPGSNTNSA